MKNVDYPILATKLHIPEPRPDLVSRTALIERLNRGIRRKLTLISAPAGFGKTTILSDWIYQAQLPVAWISLDQSDNDPVLFTRYAIAALRKIEPKIGETALDLLQLPQPPPYDAILYNLVQEIEDIPQEFVLVFDDYHVIDTEQTHQLVELLLNNMPPQWHLVLATRVDPPLPLARMRVRNQLTEFRVSDLCFTEDETTLFFNTAMDLNLSNRDIAVLRARTEGGIAGLQLAALSMQGRSDLSDFISAFAGDDRLIVDYLVEEVLSHQSANVQDFLLYTSILNRLSESLCDYVTERQGSQNVLDDLEKANLFLVPLDNKRKWYRYHHLFADLLRQRLKQKQGNRVSRLHMKASEWLESNDFKEEAIEHALAANEFERAAHLIEEYISAKWYGGGQVTLLKWLGELPSEFKMRKPNLGLCHARTLFQSGRQEAAEKLIDHLERTNETPEASTNIVFQGRIAAIRAYMATRKGDLPSISKYSQQALEILSEEDSTWRSIIATSSGIAHDLQGDGRAAIEAHFEAVEAAKKAGNVYLYLINRLWVTIALKYAGRLPEAMSLCRQLLNEINDKSLTFNVAAVHVWGTWGELLYELNALDEAHRYAKKGVELLEQGHDVSHLGHRYCCLAKILCSKEDLAGAEEIVSKMDRLSRSSVIPPWVTTQIKAVKARIYLMKGNTDALVKWVEECGLKPDDACTWEHDVEQIMFARILIAQRRLDEAIELLGRLIVENEKAGRRLNQIETLVIQTLACKKAKNEPKSMAAVKKALSLAEPGGYTRVFVDEGPPMAELLEKMLDAGEDLPRAFVKKLLPAFKLRRIAKHHVELAEPLSERELEVLRFIAAGLPNKKVTEQLFISMSTVKTHLRNIYGKLDVHSRTEAVAKAKELGILN
jgi:LuxR family maltose regulon positive regulatory protein